MGTQVNLSIASCIAMQSEEYAIALPACPLGPARGRELFLYL
jgi:hypothetical protein